MTCRDHSEAGLVMEFSIDATTRRQILLGGIVLAGALAGSPVAYAVTRRERDAEAQITSLVENILQVIGGHAGDAGQERRLMAAIESQTDLSLLARMTMGRYWRRASVRQRELFVDVFRRYLLRSFTSRLRRYAGTDLGAARDRFRITATKNVGKNDVMVRSRIQPPSGAPLEVDWRLRSRNGELYIIDLIVEGVSLLITQRSEFGSVLERIGIDGLIGELRTRVSRMI